MTEEKTDTKWSIDRRTVLQSAAVVSGAGLLGVSATGTAAADEHCGPGCEPQCEAEVPLCAAQNIEVGTVYVRRVPGEDEIEVEYVLDGDTENDWYLEETHLYVGQTDPTELSSAPGQFPFSEEDYGDGVTEDTYTIDFGDICEYEVQSGNKWEEGTNCGVEEGDCVYIAAHAVVYTVTCGELGEPSFWANRIEADLGNQNDGADVQDKYADSSVVLGEPDDEHQIDNAFLSLGFGGSATVEFEGPVYNTDGNDDIFVYETTGSSSFTWNRYPKEKAEVHVREVGSDSFVYAGEVSNKDTVDGWEGLGTVGIPSGIVAVDAVKIIDITESDDHDDEANGYDLNAVGADCIIDQDETAWGDGCDGCEITDGGNWATYFQYGIGNCIEEVCVDVLEGLEAGDEIGGQSLEGVTITSPDDGTIVALEEGEEPRFYGAPNESAADNGCMGEKVDVGFGDKTANDAGDPQDLDFAFDDPVQEFELRMLDYGDFNPDEDKHHLVEITAFNGDDDEVASEKIEYWTDSEVNPTEAYETSDMEDVLWEDLYEAGDACDAEAGQPGDYTFKLAGEDIERVELRFGAGHDPKIAFDLPCITKEV